MTGRTGCRAPAWTRRRRPSLDMTMRAWVDERLAQGATPDEIYAELDPALIDEDQRSAVWLYACSVQLRAERGWSPDGPERLREAIRIGRVVRPATSRWSRGNARRTLSGRASKVAVAHTDVGAENAMTPPASTNGCADGFSHEALFYAGRDDFAGRLAPFVREGVAAGRAVVGGVT